MNYCPNCSCSSCVLASSRQLADKISRQRVYDAMRRYGGLFQFDPKERVWTGALCPRPKTGQVIKVRVQVTDLEDILAAMEYSGEIQELPLDSRTISLWKLGQHGKALYEWCLQSKYEVACGSCVSCLSTKKRLKEP